jgi:hypothetical protein
MVAAPASDPQKFFAGIRIRENCRKRGIFARQADSDDTRFELISNHLLGDQAVPIQQNRITPMSSNEWVTRELG